MTSSASANYSFPVERAEFWDLLGVTRFFLAAIVMVTHLECFLKPNSLQEHVTRFCAFSSVLCFLAISGFSIAASLDRAPHQFYRRRLARVYPLYLLCILQGVTFAYLAHVPYPATVKNVVANMMFLQTFIAQPLGSNVVIWSLGVEVFFYALAPWFQRLNSRNLLGLASASGVAFLVFPNLKIPTYYAFLNFGAASLFLGWSWIGGFLYYRHRQMPQAGVILLASMIVLTTYNHFHVQRWSQMTIVASIGILITGRSISISPMTQKVFKYLGEISFPLYLVHFPVYQLLYLRWNLHSPYVFMMSAVVFAIFCLWVDARVRKPFALLLDWVDSRRCEAVLLTSRSSISVRAATLSLLSPGIAPLAD